MKYIIAHLSLFFLFIFLIPITKVNADSQGNYFVVTAYYSPLPDQKYYMTGDFDSEQRLQGKGIAGASGAPVFSGMLAAPKKYEFGTKVYIEGLGIGDIQDRGGAIVRAGKRGYEYDRLDVWMGYGDEGLKRALTWGKRTVPGYVVSSNSAVTINYKNHPAPDWAVQGLERKDLQQTVFDYSLGIDSDGEKVEKLQIFFQDIGIYRGQINGVYNSELIDIILDFQLASDIIVDENDYGAGYWGPKTRNIFKKMYLDGEFDVQNKEVTIEEVGKEDEVEVEVEKNIFNSYEGSKEEQENILEILQQVGEYEGNIDVDNSIFVDVIYDFQIKYKIIKDQTDLGAGFFGPKTRKRLEELYMEKKQNENRKESLEEKYEEIEKTSILKQTVDTVKKIGNLEEGDTSDSVRELQSVLKELGYFDMKPTAYFGPITKESVTEFQLAYNLIDSQESLYAGVVGDRTLETIGTEYLKLLKN